MLLRIIVFVGVLVCSQFGFSQNIKTVSAPLKKKTLHLSTGITLRYLETGVRGGEVLILLHGYTDTSRSFYVVMDSLQNIFPDLHIFAPDLRGHGDSSLPLYEGCAQVPEKCFRFSDFAADVIAFMDQQHIAAAHIAGHSMGSVIAQELALSYPTRIKSLVLIGSSAKGTKNTVINDFLLRETVEGAWKTALQKRRQFTWPQDAYALTIQDVIPESFTWLASSWVADPVADPGFIRQIIPETARVPLGTWIGAIRNLSRFDNTKRLHQLTIPTLVLWGTQDNVFPWIPDQVELKDALDQAVKAGRTTYYFKVYGKRSLPPSGLQENDLGHNTHWGAPQAVAADIASFIRTGKPTTDLSYADPLNVKKVLLDKLGHGQ